MVALAKPKRSIPANVWRAARSLCASDPMLTLHRVAERFDLSLPAVFKRSSRERWRERFLDGAGDSSGQKSNVVSELVPVVTLGDFRKAVQAEAVAWLCLLRQARRTTVRTCSPPLPPNNRIRRLLDLLPGDLSQDKLDTFSREFDALAQDSPKSSCSLSCITFAGGSPPRWLARLFPSRGFKN